MRLIIYHQEYERAYHAPGLYRLHTVCLLQIVYATQTSLPLSHIVKDIEQVFIEEHKYSPGVSCPVSVHKASLEGEQPGENLKKLLFPTVVDEGPETKGENKQSNGCKEEKIKDTLEKGNFSIEDSFLQVDDTETRSTIEVNVLKVQKDSVSKSALKVRTLYFQILRIISYVIYAI